MVSSFRVYPRGFCLTPVETDLFDDLPHFKHVALNRQYHLYVDDAAGHDVATAGDTDGVVIVGKAWPMSTGVVPSDTDSPAQSLLDIYRSAENHLDGLRSIEDALYDFAGRYAVVVCTENDLVLYNDAVGTRTVYFNERTRQVASHYDMLARLSGKPAAGLEFGEARWEATWDVTDHEDIFALLPNHRFRFDGLSRERFFLTEPNRAADMLEETKFKTVFKLWDEQMQWMLRCSDGRKIHFSMTGGMDSRTTLAMARKYVKKFSSFTYTVREAVPETAGPLKTNFQRVLGRDYRIVKRLEEFLPEGHRFIVRKAEGSGLSADDISVLKRNCLLRSGHGRWILPGYMEASKDIRTIHYRGNLLEIGRLYGGSTVGTDPRAVARRRSRAFAAKQKLSTDKFVEFFLQKFDDFKFDEIHKDYETNDAFYWEHRHGRWYSEVLNETDIAFDTISPFNCRRIIDIFLSFEPEVRKQAYMQKELIYRAHPVLMFFGINEDTDLYEQQKKLNND